MLFVELRFLLFFLLAFGVHWSLRGMRARKVWLLLCSYAFYAAWDWRFLSLILISTLVDFWVGLRLETAQTRRRAILSVSVVTNLGLLGFFKYFDFFTGSANQLLLKLGLPSDLPTLELVLPVGISFYTFQTLSYSIDVYRGRLKACHDILDLAMFVAFFPQLVAGPIVRAVDFLHQLEKPRVLRQVDMRFALTLVLAGFVKKACVSDNLAPYVDPYFADPQNYDTLGAWAAVVFYVVQIYCDFSGYSDIAIGCAALLGYRLRLNFFFPYFAGNIALFWNRWHVSLSSWLRDYLYIPLGGSHGTRLQHYRNVTITMMLCGLWHGAAWNFVLFGLLHAVVMIVRMGWRNTTREGSPTRRVVAFLGCPLTLWFFATSLIVFRSENWEGMILTARSFLFFEDAGTKNFGTVFLWVVPLLYLVHGVAYRRTFVELWQALPRWAFAAVYGAAVALALAFMASDTQPFIYFQF